MSCADMTPPPAANRKGTGAMASSRDRPPGKRVELWTVGYPTVAIHKQAHLLWPIQASIGSHCCLVGAVGTLCDMFCRPLWVRRHAVDPDGFRAIQGQAATDSRCLALGPWKCPCW